MRDVHKSGAKGRLQLLELNLHVLAQFQVQRAQRLVQQQQSGLKHQAARYCHALLLPARELVNALGLRAGQAHALQHLAHAAFDLGRSHAPARQAIANVVAHRHHGKQRQVLKHHIDRALIGQHAVHGLAADQDVALVRALKARNHAQQGRLAAARWPKNAKKTAARHAKRQIGHRRKAAVVLAHPQGLQVGVRGLGHGR